MGRRAGNITFQSLGGSLKGIILLLGIVRNNFWGINKKQRSCDGRRGGAQRPVWRGNEPKKTGARSARARTRGQNPLVNKYRYKNTAGFFVIPLLDQFWEEKNYCERRNELSQRRPVALPNHHKHLCLFKLGYEVHVLLSSIMYILSGKKITAVYPMSRRRWDQNTTQVDNRLDRARATYVRLLHISSMGIC